MWPDTEHGVQAPGVGTSADAGAIVEEPHIVQLEGGFTGSGAGSTDWSSDGFNNGFISWFRTSQGRGESFR
jgi:hypothetical protein